MLSVRETMNPNSRRFSKAAFQAAVQVLKEYRDEERKAEEQAKQIINQ
jgi:cation transport regulator ChaB